MCPFVYAILKFPTVLSSLLPPRTSPLIIYLLYCCLWLTEECTAEYIDRIWERYQGKWICGLCAEVVKDEIVRCERLISTDDALTLHMNIFKKFNFAGPPANPAVHLISAMRQILRRREDSPRSLGSMPSSPTRSTNARASRAVLSRTEICMSCIANLSLVDTSVFLIIEEGKGGE